MTSLHERRDFLKQATALTALWGVSLQGASAFSQPSGANDRLRIGCIGVGNRGAGVSRHAARHGEIAMICDVDLNCAEWVKGQLKAAGAEVCQDYRRVLDRDDIDVIIQGCPDHWHTKINIEACRANKDVYAEKPATLTIDEGKILRDVVRKTGRIVQIGTQQRSGAPFQTAVELIRAGRIGDIKTVYVALPFYPSIGGPFSAEPVPAGLNWDLFQGQAPEADYCTMRKKNWRRWWAYSGGNITDWGNHHTDILLWGLDAEHSGPVSVEARGIFPNEGRAGCDETPDRFCSRMMFKGRSGKEIDVLFFAAIGDQRKNQKAGRETPVSEEQLDILFGKDCPEEVKATDRNGLLFIGESGRLFVNRGGVFGKAVEELKENPLPEDAWRAPNRAELADKSEDSTGSHVNNFFQSVRTRTQPVAPVDVEHRAVTLCHLTNISILLGGRKLTWDPEKEEIMGDSEASAMQSRPQREPYTIDP